MTVVIPAYNPDRRFLEAAIASALAQTRPPRAIVVVDDGSREAPDWLPDRFGARITLLRQENGGPARARNTGVKAAATPYVAFLDADDVWEPGLLQAATAVLDVRPEVAMFYSPVVKIDAADRPVGRSQRPALSGHIFESLFFGNCITTSSVVARKSCLESAGLFDEDRALFAVEDYDLWLRIAAAHPIVASDRPLVRYRVHDTGISRDPERSYTGERLVIERALQRHAHSHPGLLAARDRRLRQIDFELGQELFLAGRFAQARAALGRGLRHDARDVRTWIYYLASRLPRAVAGYRKARALWR